MSRKKNIFYKPFKDIRNDNNYLLEVFDSEYGWGGVCDEHGEFGYNEASVACKSLGLGEPLDYGRYKTKFDGNYHSFYYHVLKNIK